MDEPLDGGAHPARDGAGGHRRHRLLPRGRAEPHPLHGRGPPRLADQPPARLGHAAGHVRRQGRPASRCTTTRSTPASSTPIAEDGADAWFTRPDADFLGDHDPGRYEKIEDILDVWFDSGSTHAFTLEDRARHPLAGRPLSRRLRPAPRLVPVLAAGKLRHPRPRALRRRPDPRLHPGRERGEDVQVAGQHHRAAVGHQGIAAPRSCACGSPWSTTPRTSGSARRSCRPPSTPTASCATPCATCWAPWPASTRPSAWPTPRCRRWSASSCTGCGSSTARCATPTTTTASRTSSGRCSSSAPTTCRPSTSTSARTASTATAPTRCAAAPARTVMDEVFERLTVWLAPLIPFTMEEAWTTRFPGRRLQLPAGHPRDAGRLAQRRRGRALGQGRSRCSAWSPARWRSSAARSGSARRWRPRRVVHVADAGLLAGLRRPRRRRGVPHQPGDAGRGRRPGRGLPPARVSRASPSSRCRAEGGKCARSWRILPEVGLRPALSRPVAARRRRGGRLGRGRACR